MLVKTFILSDIQSMKLNKDFTPNVIRLFAHQKIFRRKLAFFQLIKLPMFFHLYFLIVFHFFLNYIRQLHTYILYCEHVVNEHESNEPTTQPKSENWTSKAIHHQCHIRIVLKCKMLKHSQIIPICELIHFGAVFALCLVEFFHLSISDNLNSDFFLRLPAFHYHLIYFFPKSFKLKLVSLNELWEVNAPSIKKKRLKKSKKFGIYLNNGSSYGTWIIFIFNNFHKNLK